MKKFLFLFLLFPSLVFAGDGFWSTVGDTRSFSIPQDDGVCFVMYNYFAGIKCVGAGCVYQQVGTPYGLYIVARNSDCSTGNNGQVPMISPIDLRYYRIFVDYSAQTVRFQENTTYNPPPPPDEDGDGVEDSQDQCSGTPPGTPVDSVGCALEPDHCNDGSASGDELGIDCGGSCFAECNEQCPEGYSLMNDTCGNTGKRCVKLYAPDANGNCWINTISANEYCQLTSEPTGFVIYGEDFCIEFEDLIRSSDPPQDEDDPLNEDTPPPPPPPTNSESVQNEVIENDDGTKTYREIRTVYSSETKNNDDGSQTIETDTTITTTDDVVDPQTGETLETNITIENNYYNTTIIPNQDGTQTQITDTGTRNMDTGGNVLNETSNTDTTTSPIPPSFQNYDTSTPDFTGSDSSIIQSGSTRFGTRFETFKTNVSNAPVYAAFDNIFSPDLSGGNSIYILDGGSLGTFEIDLSFYSAAWAIIKYALIFLAMFVAARIVLVNK